MCWAGLKWCKSVDGRLITLWNLDWLKLVHLRSFWEVSFPAGPSGKLVGSFLPSGTINRLKLSVIKHPNDSRNSKQTDCRQIQNNFFHCRRQSHHKQAHVESDTTVICIGAQASVPTQKAARKKCVIKKR